MGPTTQGNPNWTLEDRGRPQRELFEQNKLLYFRSLHRKKTSHFTFFVYAHDGKAGALKLTPPPPLQKKPFDCQNSVHDVNL